MQSASLSAFDLLLKTETLYLFASASDSTFEFESGSEFESCSVTASELMS